jgi:hypothetical protein
MPGDWRLDNFHGDPGNREPKGGADYEAHYFVDVDRDGQTDDLGEYYIYDLRFTHARDDGVIWLRTVPLPLDDADKALRVLANAYVEGIAHDRYEVVQLEGTLRATNTEVSYATQMLSSASGTVGDQEAFGVMVNVANTNQLKLDPNARWKRVELVLVRTPFAFKVKSGHKKGDGPIPVLMVLGYASSLEDFDTDRGAFEDLLSRVSLGRDLGARLAWKSTTPAAPAASGQAAVNREASAPSAGAAPPSGSQDPPRDPAPSSASPR